MKPIIGITSNYSTLDFHGISTKIGTPKQEWQLLADDYIYSIEQAGGIPLILPVLRSHDDIALLLSKLDGLLLAGGSDVDPKYYNQEPKDGLGGLMPKRDYYEIELAKVAIRDTDLPILGICRGCQVLTVAQGGSLYQDTRYQKATGVKHRWSESPKEAQVHQVNIEPHSTFMAIFQKARMGVNSFHHQSIEQLGKGFKATMLSDDKTIEGIEMKGERFVVGTQWHPEMMVEHDDYYMKIFKELINRSQGDADSKRVL